MKAEVAALSDKAASSAAARRLLAAQDYLEEETQWGKFSR
jgi:hypothetical protein